MPRKIQSFNTGTFTKETSVPPFDNSLWAATNGTINWYDYPTQDPYSESDIFHTQLTHTTGGEPSDLNWTIRIGKGGQLYYADIEGVGQIICPQRVFSAWNDDCMTTTVYSSDVVDNSPELKVGPYNDYWTNGYIHGSGMYVKPHMDPLSKKPFYNPILSEKFDPIDRSYTIINWGLVPKPSINRGDVLFYSRYRDLGHGILEITFYCYNFGNRLYNFAETPWFAVRPSKFPSMVEGINGTSSFKINNKTFQSGAISKLGGWGAHTVDPLNPQSLSCGLVWGSNGSEQMALNFGFVDRTIRDMSLMAPSVNSFNMSYGTGIRYRRFVVMGKLCNVADICSKLNNYAFFEKIEFNNSYSGKMPLYASVLNGSLIFTNEEIGLPVCYTFPIPVKDSLPLFLLKNTVNNNYFLTTDPYAACGKKPFTNPYPPNHIKYPKYQNRHIYQVYDGKTEWINLLGYVLPINNNDIPMGYVRLSDVLGGVQFLKGEKLNSNDLMVMV